MRLMRMVRAHAERDDVIKQPEPLDAHGTHALIAYLSEVGCQRDSSTSLPRLLEVTRLHILLQVAATPGVGLLPLVKK